MAGFDQAQLVKGVGYLATLRIVVNDLKECTFRFVQVGFRRMQLAQPIVTIGGKRRIRVSGNKRIESLDRFTKLTRLHLGKGVLVSSLGIGTATAG